MMYKGEFDGTHPTGKAWLQQEEGRIYMDASTGMDGRTRCIKGGVCWFYESQAK